MPYRIESGFIGAELSDEIQHNNSAVESSASNKTDENERIFLVSNDPIEPYYSVNENWVPHSSPKTKRTRNRKRVTYDEHFNFKGTNYKINSSKSGVYVETMHSMLNQFEICLEKWSRVFVYRFDLHTSISSSNNRIISIFIKNLVARIKWNYQVDEVGYCWVREQERAKSQHYHCVLFIDGDRIRHPSKLIQMIKQLWETTEGYNHVPVIQSPFYFVDNEISKKDVVYRISYLAKARGKGYRPPQTKDYGCSRVKISKYIQDKHYE